MRIPCFSRQAAVVALLFACCTPALAAQQIWTGATDADWQTETNWNSAVQTASDSAVFNASSTANLDLTLSANASVLGLQILDPTGPISIAGNPLTIGTGGIDMSAAAQDLTSRQA